ncbi:hypothetical protein KJ786_02895 [Patescibacteria group bacterium]|nr:hypothetical protein [Patescibacteria group bacterium]
MKDKLKKLIPIFILTYCLIIVPTILYKYSVYLDKPNNYIWEQVKEYLIYSGKYNNEPIVFNPSWLKNYATDYSRFQKFNIVRKNNNFYSYWLISMDKKSVPKNYQAVATKEIKNLFVFKLIQVK